MNNPYPRKPNQSGYIRPGKIIFLDLDGVLFDYEGYCKRFGLPLSGAGMKVPGFYTQLQPFPGAVEFVQKLEELYPGQVRICTACSTARPAAWAEKVESIQEHFPEMITKLIITRDKSACGTEADILVDDNMHLSGAHQFPGHKIPFYYGATAYEDTLAMIKALMGTALLIMKE